MESRGPAETDDCAIIGASPSIRRAVATARRFAATQLPVLLTGATGTGKELFAQEIHRWSGRSGRLVDVNCGALPRDLVEGELFGHRRGAYTGASTDSGGLIAHAHGGTLFLDELSSLPLEGQVKLLRALETREVRRVGDTDKRLIDFRLVVAAPNGLARLVREGHFRIDLYQRLAGVVIDLPPLVERMEDVLPLARYFGGLQHRVLGGGAESVLSRYEWPGNVRELKTVVDRAVVLSRSGAVEAWALVEAIDLGQSDHTESGDVASLEEGRLKGERVRMIDTAKRNGWNPRRMAMDLGVSRATVYRRLRALGLTLPTISQSHDSHDSHQSHQSHQSHVILETGETGLRKSYEVTPERNST